MTKWKQKILSWIKEEVSTQPSRGEKTRLKKRLLIVMIDGIRLVLARPLVSW